jgi:hypothetical protein
VQVLQDEHARLRGKDGPQSGEESCRREFLVRSRQIEPELVRDIDQWAQRSWCRCAVAASEQSSGRRLDLPEQRCGERRFARPGLGAHEDQSTVGAPCVSPGVRQDRELAVSLQQSHASHPVWTAAVGEANDSPEALRRA